MDLSFIAISLLAGMSQRRSAASPSSDTLPRRGKSVCSAGDAPPRTLCRNNRDQALGLPSPVLTDFSIDASAKVGGGEAADRLYLSSLASRPIAKSTAPLTLLPEASSRGQATHGVRHPRPPVMFDESRLWRDEEFAGGRKQEDAALPPSLRSDRRRAEGGWGASLCSVV